MATDFSKLKDLYEAKDWDPFIESAREHGIPNCVLSLLVEEPRAWKFETPDAFLAPNVKPFLDLLWGSCYIKVGSQMVAIADARDPGDILAMLLRGHALDYLAIAGEWRQMVDVLHPIMSYWHPPILKPALEDPAHGHAVAWVWVYRILYYAQYVTDHSEGLKGYQYMCGEALSKWQKILSEQQPKQPAIAPEITESDSFGQALARLLKEDPTIKTVIEVGASTGVGSTAILAKNISEYSSIIALETDPERYKQLFERYGRSSVVYPRQGVITNSICSYQDVMDFFRLHPESPLCRYGLYEVLSWLRRDQERDPLPELDLSGTPDLVLLDGSEFQGWQDFHGIHSKYPARYYALDDILTLKNHRVYEYLLSLHPGWQLWAEDKTCRHGWAIFKNPFADKECEENLAIERSSLPPKEDPTVKESLTVQDPALPIRFFTIVLDGDPFIQQHLSRFQQLSMPWEWWICEGVALHRHDTAWAKGGTIPAGYEQGYSKDGTTVYLDLIKDPRVKIVRKEIYQYWDGKIEMVRAVGSPDHECLLWQVDADELWDPNQIETVYKKFVEDPTLGRAAFFCRYFVGPGLFLDNKGSWGNNPNQEWSRVWRWDRDNKWHAHEPPTVIGDYAYTYMVSPEQTEQWGVTFDHYAYATRKQVEFKEKYYGDDYKGAVSLWDHLQRAPKPCKLAPFMPWSYGDITVHETRDPVPEFLRAYRRDSLERAVDRSIETNNKIMQGEKDPIQPAQPATKSRLLIDGIFFSMLKTGIARVWKSLIPELRALGHEIALLDRGGTEGIDVDVKYPMDDPYPGELALATTDRSCFLSTYYTHLAKGSRQVLLLHDMIPEIYGWDAPEWRQKRQAIEATGSLLCVSQNTQKDLLKFYGRESTLAYPGVDHNLFKPASEPVDPSYWFLTGFFPNTYKNTEQFLSTRLSRLIPSVATMTTQEGQIGGSHSIRCAGIVEDDELVKLYHGAIALVYPSLYEGFGLPVLEAMACGIPVICNPVASLPEVGGNAAIYVHDGNMEAALAKVLDPSVRSMAINAGIQQASQFTWAKMAGILSDVIENTKGES